MSLAWEVTNEDIKMALQEANLPNGENYLEEVGASSRFTKS